MYVFFFRIYFIIGLLFFYRDMDSYALLQIHETLNFNIRDDKQYELGLKNLEIEVEQLRYISV